MNECFDCIGAAQKRITREQIASQCVAYGARKLWASETALHRATPCVVIAPFSLR